MGALTVVGAGPAGWDSGSDLFLEVVRCLAAERSVDAVWIGRRSRGVARWLDLDLELMQLEGLIRWKDDVPSGLAADAMILTARTPAARDQSLDAVQPPPTVCGFSLVGSPSPPGVETVDFPDTLAMADRIVRRLAGDESRQG